MERQLAIITCIIIFTMISGMSALKNDIESMIWSLKQEIRELKEKQNND